MKTLRVWILLVIFSVSTLSAQVLVRQDFENGIGGWLAISMNTDNNLAFGIKSGNIAHSGANYFQFSSYTRANDYNQYLISPALSLTSQATVSFYLRDKEGRGDEEIKVMVSSTDSAVASFTDVSSTITATASWQRYTVTIPANTRFVAFNYVSDYKYYLCIDDIAITQIASTPEVSLEQINLPDGVSAGMPFNIGGVVRNNSSVALTSLEVSYTINGTTTRDTLQNLSVNTDNTYSFVHGVPAVVQNQGKTAITLSVSKPNNVVDNTTDNTITDTLDVCGVISQLPYSQGFEEGLKCWKAIAVTNDNTGRFGLNNPYSSNPHSGEHYFQFSSWYQSSDYAQYLISPEMNLTVPARLEFYAKDLYGEGNETFQVMYSQTTDDIESFDSVAAETAGGSWTAYQYLVPAGTKFVMIKYTSRYQYLMGIDDIVLSEAQSAPEIELVSMKAPYAIGAGVNFVVSGTVKNHSINPVTKLTARCIIGNDTTTDVINGLNIPFERTATFAMQTPVMISTPGEKTVKLEVILPNDVADAEGDNAQTFAVSVYDTLNAVPRKVFMEHFSTASCPNCIDGHTRIETAMEEGGYYDDVIWVTHHSGYYTDRFTTELDETMKCFFNNGGSTYAPAVMMDRTNLAHLDCTHGNGVPPGPVFFPYTHLDEAIEYALQQPAFVKVEVSTMSYDSVTRALSATVSGEVMAQLAATDPRLNVWLVEDSLIADGGTEPGHGPTQSYGDPETFKHNHVIREVLSSNDWGDANVVINSAHATFTHTYNFTVSADYIDEHCYLVAFVSEGNHTDMNNCKVFNSTKSRFITEEETVDTTAHDTVPEPPYPQEYTITATCDGSKLAEGDTIYVTVSHDEMADVYVGYGNCGKEDLTMRISREQKVMIDGEVEGFCVGATCYGGDVSGDINVASGRSVDESDHTKALHISFVSSSAGDALTQYTMENVADPGDKLSFYVAYHVEGDTTIEDGVGNVTAEKMAVYPNPARDVVMIEGLELTDAQYTIYSAAGQIVKEGVTSGSISVGMLPSSVYILEVVAEGKRHRVNIIVE